LKLCVGADTGGVVAINEGGIRDNDNSIELRHRTWMSSNL
jgi:hypothetical protein